MQIQFKNGGESDNDASHFPGPASLRHPGEKKGPFNNWPEPSRTIKCVKLLGKVCQLKNGYHSDRSGSGHRFPAGMLIFIWRLNSICQRSTDIMKGVDVVVLLFL
jgi:hypothetical protein